MHFSEWWSQVGFLYLLNNGSIQYLPHDSTQSFVKSPFFPILSKAATKIELAPISLRYFSEPFIEVRLQMKCTPPHFVVCHSVVALEHPPLLDPVSISDFVRPQVCPRWLLPDEELAALTNRTSYGLEISSWLCGWVCWNDLFDVILEVVGKWDIKQPSGVSGGGDFVGQDGQRLLY